MVMFLCRQVSPEEVFDTNSLSPLSQPVLLSLIQQVTVDLADEVELKVKYVTTVCVLRVYVKVFGACYTVP